ncbi:hypothetical protein CHH26_06775 [Qipengyuania flava]|uniref:ATP-grasp domain-containing protein n=1 Tax=Qipengyuania flava TaxID=192812 RepID=UPI000B8C3E9C|nr:hypothetical protein [Qipengyuania flava]ASP29968.1 hypothetical protein CHH26_06775 [Qipengyuania flava]
MIAIHTKSGSFVSAWVKFCDENSIAYKEVNCFDTDIIDQLQGCRALLWNWAHHDYRAQIFARQLTASVERMGVAVFPSSSTAWHYDDKVGQKYLLEAIGAPIVPSFVFYDEGEALDWVETTSFPKVWKLRSGAGSQNVRLISNARLARNYVRKAFSTGWSNSRAHAFKDRLWDFRKERNLKTLLNISKGVARLVVPHQNNRKSPLQRDYIYFQDFIPDNDCDIRVIVIGEKAFAIKRMVRGGDFRASGSGIIRYDRQEIPIDCIEVAFEVTDALGSQSCAFDFVQRDGEWLIVEVSYAFNLAGYSRCPGYWRKDLTWCQGPVLPEQYMIENLLSNSEG